MTLERLLNLTEVSDVLGLKDEGTVRDLVMRGELPAVRLNQRVVRIRPSDLQKFLKDRTTVPPQPGRSGPVRVVATR